ncbi:Retrovirus-related Pol polyprotein from transposon RE1 [Vitis vinifera]|uniref:Retrovirus-related Pol polyprotein from transposon RE1 n=1 Tax=Vitis vinifera TaxID=29760 RepID=A0A438DAF0_VITVI|nr:Retrovirus-related Pol polyprotein from transposon RE1 [Vitis vinifera]
MVKNRIGWMFGDNLAHPNDGNNMVEPPRTEVEPIPESSKDAESDESLHSLVPNDPPPENIPETQSRQATNSILSKHRRTAIQVSNSQLCVHSKLSEPLKAFAHTLSSCQIPSSVEEALSDSKWAQAIKEELEALQKNNTWVLSVLPEGRKMVGCKWIFSFKYKVDGSIDRYKARVLLSLVANLDWPLHQLDVKNAFLHGDLEEEIYMDLPPGYTATSRQRSHVGASDKQRYQRLVGKLIYLSHTRPDIAYAVSVVSQFMHCPSEDHMDAVMWILCYLKSSHGKGLMFSKNGHLNVAGYTDADWVGNITERKSTSGYFTFVGGNLVTWRSKKQKLLAEIGVAPSSEMNLFCDNKAAIAISHNSVQHDRTKHVEEGNHKQGAQLGIHIRMVAASLRAEANGAAANLPVGSGALAAITRLAVPSGQYPSDGILARAPEAGSNCP